MEPTERDARLVAEYEALRSLKSASSLFDFEAEGELPENYLLIFRGKGLARDVAANSNVEFVELHRVEIRLPFSYPESPPDIRWLTSIFHPNVSYSGFVNLREIGLPWEKDLGLDAVAERLWDVARMAYMAEEQASNYAAKKWFREQQEFALPVDARPLRDLSSGAVSNVVHYERREGRRVVPPSSAQRGDVLYIGDDTPTPELPIRVAPARPTAANDGDVLYIGDE